MIPRAVMPSFLRLVGSTLSAPFLCEAAKFIFTRIGAANRLQKLSAPDTNTLRQFECFQPRSSRDELAGTVSDNMPRRKSLILLIAKMGEQRNLRIPTQSGHRFRFEAGHRSDLMPATIPK
jgi:hypothetical protein